MALSTTVINEVWRPFYGDLVEGFQLLTPEWKFFKPLKNFKQFSLRQIIWPVDLIIGGGISMTVDGGSTSRAASNAPVDATDSWAHMTGRYEVSYDVVTLNNAAKVAKQQIVKQLAYQTRDKLKAFRKRMSWGFYGHADGVMALVLSAAGAPTYTLKDRYGETGLATDVTWITPNKDYVAIIDPGGPTIRGIELVTAVDRTLQDVTLAASIAGAAVNDQLVFANHISNVAADTDTDLNQGFNGLLDITSAASLHGITTASQPDWSAAIDTALGGSLSGTVLYKDFETASKESGHSTDFAWTTIGAIASAGGAQLDQRRYGADDDTLRLGFKKLNIMGVQTEGMLYCPPGHFFAGARSALRKLTPDTEVKDFKTGGVMGGSFVAYPNDLGYYKDQVFRIQLTAISRKAFIHHTTVTEA